MPTFLSELIHNGGQVRDAEAWFGGWVETHPGSVFHSLHPFQLGLGFVVLGFCWPHFHRPHVALARAGFPEKTARLGAALAYAGGAMMIAMPLGMWWILIGTGWLVAALMEARRYDEAAAAADHALGVSGRYLPSGLRYANEWRTGLSHMKEDADADRIRVRMPETPAATEGHSGCTTRFAFYVSAVNAEGLRRLRESPVLQPPPVVLTRVDAALGLSGALIEYAQRHGAECEPLDVVPDAGHWNALLTERFGTRWKRLGQAFPDSGIEFSVVVIDDSA